MKIIKKKAVRKSEQNEDAKSEAVRQRMLEVENEKIDCLHRPRSRPAPQGKIKSVHTLRSHQTVRFVFVAQTLGSRCSSSDPLTNWEDSHRLNGPVIAPWHADYIPVLRRKAVQSHNSRLCFFCSSSSTECPVASIIHAVRVRTFPSDFCRARASVPSTTLLPSTRLSSRTMRLTCTSSIATKQWTPSRSWSNAASPARIARTWSFRLGRVDVNSPQELHLSSPRKDHVTALLGPVLRRYTALDK